MTECWVVFDAGGTPWGTDESADVAWIEARTAVGERDDRDPGGWRRWAESVGWTCTRMVSAAELDAAKANPPWLKTCETCGTKATLFLCRCRAEEFDGGWIGLTRERNAARAEVERLRAAVVRHEEETRMGRGMIPGEIDRQLWSALAAREVKS